MLDEHNECGLPVRAKVMTLMFSVTVFAIILASAIVTSYNHT